MVEVEIGHATFFGVIRRDVLSIFNDVHVHIILEYHHPVKFWGSTCEELETFLGLMPMTYADWESSWSPDVNATGASPYGFGVPRAFLAIEHIAELARVPERRRFRLGAAQA